MADASSIVVTGASTGIGFAVAERFVAQGWQVFGSVRRPQDAERIRAAGIVPLLFDVTDQPAIAAAAAQVAEALGGRTLRALVNNAGLAVSGPMLALPLEKLRYQLEVNVVGPAAVTQAFAPLLGADGSRNGQPGRIVQISSVAAGTALPFLGAYSASKAALERMSEALRRELRIFGIGVSVVAPGPIQTPIWQKGDISDLGSYADTPFAPALQRYQKLTADAEARALPVSEVADAVWHAVTARRPRLYYYVVRRRFVEFTLPKLLPERLVDRVLTNMLGLKRERTPSTANRH